MNKITHTVTIVVCTHNGEKTINTCLESLNQLEYPLGKLNIIIIDNASDDNTKKIIHNFINKAIIPTQYYYESRLGLSNARNRGILEATGEIIAYIDDDAVATRLWIKRLVKTYRYPQVGCTGGKVIPTTKIIPSNKFPIHALNYLGIFDLGDKEATCLSDIYPIGCNISYRKNIFEQIGYFDITLGRIGQSLLSSEEIDLCQRLQRVGYTIIYEPRAIVYHNINKNKFSLIYLLKRYYMEGVSQARIKSTRKNNYIYLMSIAPLQILRFILSRRYIHLYGASYSIGYLVSIYQKNKQISNEQ